VISGGRKDRCTILRIQIFYETCNKMASMGWMGRVTIGVHNGTYRSMN
jgi:hypothetical protein